MFRTASGVRIQGVIPGEIGSEINAVWTASKKNIALVDTDMVGGRAVPEEDMDIYGIRNIDSTPVIVVNDQSDVIIVKDSKNGAILESVYRAFCGRFRRLLLYCKQANSQGRCSFNTATGNNVTVDFDRRRNAHL